MIAFILNYKAKKKSAEYFERLQGFLDERQLKADVLPAILKRLKAQARLCKGMLFAYCVDPFAGYLYLI